MEILWRKDDGNIKREQTSIATVRNHIWTVASLPTPLIFHYLLPIKKCDVNYCIQLSSPTQDISSILGTPSVTRWASVVPTFFPPIFPPWLLVSNWITFHLSSHLWEVISYFPPSPPLKKLLSNLLINTFLLTLPLVSNLTNLLTSYFSSCLSYPPFSWPLASTCNLLSSHFDLLDGEKSALFFPPWLLVSNLLNFNISCQFNHASHLSSCLDLLILFIRPKGGWSCTFIGFYMAKNITKVNEKKKTQ